MRDVVVRKEGGRESDGALLKADFHVFHKFEPRSRPAAHVSLLAVVNADTHAHPQHVLSVNAVLPELSTSSRTDYSAVRSGTVMSGLAS